MADNSVSIVIPAYNAENTIENTLDSIKNMKFQNTEVIIVDDGSKNGYNYLKEKYPTLDIRIFKNPENLGVALTKDVCLSKANYKWVTIVDSDDLVTPNFLEEFSDEDFCNHLENVGLVQYSAMCIGWRQENCLQNFTKEPKKLDLPNIFKIADTFSSLIENPLLSCIPVHPLIIEQGFDNTYEKNWDSYNFKMVQPECEYFEHGKIYRTESIRQRGIVHEIGLPFGEDYKFNMLYNEYMLKNQENTLTMCKIGYIYCRNVDSIMAKYEYKKGGDDNG